MSLFQLLMFQDTVFGHIILVIYLFAILDEKNRKRRLRKLPPLILSPLIAAVLNLGLDVVIPEYGILCYTIDSVVILCMCTLWVMWAWEMSFWPAFSATCMAAVFQVATSAFLQVIRPLIPYDGNHPFLSLQAMCLPMVLVAVLVSGLLLGKVRFGVWFRRLLEDKDNQRRWAMLCFAMEVSMDAFLVMQNGVMEAYLVAYYLMVIVLAALMAGLVVYLARRFDDGRRIQAQQDIIAQQQLYERNLEEIRQEVRSFRHDYKNLLAGLSWQAGEGELEKLRATLEELDAGFDRSLGEKIQASTQIGNLRIPQVRSLLLNKLTVMQKKGVKCHLEVLYPMESVNMDVWDLTRCLGILVDNAMEAALETAQPWVEIVLLAQAQGVSVRVSNSWNEAADPARFDEAGWSTKGEGRGLGLAGYRKMLEGYHNVVSATGWKDGVFVQELSISG